MSYTDHKNNMPLTYWSRVVRDKTIGRMAPFLHRVGITPSQVSISGFMVAMFGLALMTVSPVWGLAVWVLGVCFDFVDGPLARIGGRMSKAGSFLDSTLDHLVLMGMAVFMIWNGYLNERIGIIYIISKAFYTSWEILSVIFLRGKDHWMNVAVRNPWVFVTILLDVWFGVSFLTDWVFGLTVAMGILFFPWELRRMYGEVKGNKQLAIRN